MGAAVRGGGKTRRGNRFGFFFPAFAFLFAFILIGTGPAAAHGGIAASVVIDQSTGKILRSHHPDTPRAPASLTKVMTLYMIFEALERGDIKLNSTWRVSRYAARRQPSKLYLRVGTRIAVRSAIYAIAVKSANDVAAVAAEGLAGSESAFARQMTKKARALGMKDTVFKNASGLPASGQKTTARDMGKLAHAVYRDFPQYYHYFSKRHFRFGRRTYRNTNRLLRRHKGIDGMKTGYTRRARYNLITTSEHKGQRVAVVILGASTSSRRYRYAAGVFTSMWGRIPAKPGTMVAEAAKRHKQGESRQTASADEKSAETDRRLALSGQAEAAERATRRAQARRTRVNAVQVGTFKEFEKARGEALRALSSLPESYSKDTHLVVAHRKGRSGTFYRARILGLSGQRADKACRLLIEKDVRCITIMHDAPARRIQAAGATQTAEAADEVKVTKTAAAANEQTEEKTEREAAAPDPGPYAIQIGAFEYLGDAKRAVKRVDGLLPSRYRAGTRSVILNRHRGYYRVRYLNMSEERAAQACRALRDRNHRCIALRHVSKSESRTASRSRSRGPYAIQVGAFKRLSQARRAARRAKAKLPRTYRNGSRMIILSRSRGYYRVRFIGLSRTKAVRACRTLRTRDVKCIALRHG